MFQRSDLWSNLFFITVEGIICNTYWGDFKLWTIFNKYFLAPELEILEKKATKKKNWFKRKCSLHTLTKILSSLNEFLDWELFAATTVDRFTLRDSLSSFESIESNGILRKFHLMH